MRGAPPPLSAFLRPALPPAALYGLPGRVAASLAESTGADPAAVLVIFLTMLGNAAGREPHADFGGAAQSCRLFSLVVGDAGRGRKGTAYDAVAPLFREADPDWSDTRIMTGLKSTVAMIQAVADGGDPRLLITETEFRRLFAIMQRSGDLSPQLRNAWDGVTLTNDVSDRRGGTLLRAHGAHVSLVGSVTPGELLPLHRRPGAAGGLESRFLYCLSAPALEVSPFRAPGDSGWLAVEVREALDASRRSVMDRADPVSAHLCARRGIQPDAVLPVADEVVTGWLTRIKPRVPDTDESLGAFFARAEAQVFRLAVGYALADQSAGIRMPHIDAALGLWTFCARSAERIFGVPVSDLPPRISRQHVARVFSHLHQRYPAWTGRDEIRSTVLSGNVPARDIDAILGDLEDKALIEQRQVPTGGRPRTEYRPKPGTG